MTIPMKRPDGVSHLAKIVLGRVYLARKIGISQREDRLARLYCRRKCYAYLLKSHALAPYALAKRKWGPFRKARSHRPSGGAAR